MATMDKIGTGSALDNAGINIFGYAEEAGPTTSPDRRIRPTSVVHDFEDHSRSIRSISPSSERLMPAKASSTSADESNGSTARTRQFLHSSGLNFYGPGDANKGGQPYPENQFDLNQAYLTFAVPVGSGLTLTAGKFVTLLGYEYVDPTQNMLFSHSYLFTFAVPTSHTGVMGQYNLTKDVSLILGFWRGVEETSKDNNGAIDGFGELSWNINDKTNVTVNISCGPQQPDDTSHYRTVVDVIGTYKLGDNTKLASMPTTATARAKGRTSGSTVCTAAATGGAWRSTRSRHSANTPT